jgi:hypothetical protein
MPADPLRATVQLLEPPLSPKRKLERTQGPCPESPLAFWPTNVQSASTAVRTTRGQCDRSSGPARCTALAKMMKRQNSRPSCRVPDQSCQGTSCSWRERPWRSERGSPECRAPGRAETSEMTAYVKSILKHAETDCAPEWTELENLISL